MEENRCLGCMELYEESCTCSHSHHQNEPHQLPVGTVLRGQYIVGRCLGQGGFGITYLGWDQTLQVKVAIKEFYPATTVNRDHSQSLLVRVNTQYMSEQYIRSRDRFLREAQALAKLKDIPQIVGIYGCFQENETAYIVMEYVQGRELKDYVSLRGGAMTPRETLRLLEPVILALGKVHSAGLVHRDISPDNIMLHPMGGAKLLDFGAVRTLEENAAGQDLARSTEAIIKQGFAPPEQYRSRGGLGPWTDEYALCATIYYCLTGRVPPEAVARSIYGEHPDWQSIGGLTPHQKWALEKGMSMQAQDRFATMEQLHSALFEEADTPVSVGEPEEDKQPPVEEAGKITDPVRPPAGLKIAAAVLAVVLAAGAGLWWLLGSRQTPGEVPVRAESAAPAETEPVTEPTEPQPAWTQNVLMANPFDNLSIPKLDLTAAVFMDTLEGAPGDALDASADGSGKVLMWLEDTTVYVAAEGGINGRESCRSLFGTDVYGYMSLDQVSYLESVDFGGAFHTEETVDFSNMFCGCAYLEDLEVSGMVTANAQDLTAMFLGCQSLEKLEVGNWNTENVRSMPYLFSSCKRLEALDVGGWDVSNAEDLGYLFMGCESLGNVETGRWDVSNVDSLRLMFDSCLSMTQLNVENWDVSQVTDMSGLFSACQSVSRLDLSRWDTSCVEDMYMMFSGSSGLTSLNLTGWDTAKVRDMSYMFAFCEKLETPDVGSFNTSQVTNMASMFQYCTSMKSLDLSSFDTSSVTNMSEMFSLCLSLERVDVSGFNTARVTAMDSMFFGCMMLEPVDISGWDVSNVKSYDHFMNDGDKLADGRHWKSLFA